MSIRKNNAAIVIVLLSLLRVPQQMTLPFAEIAHQPGVMRYETVNSGF
jgi:hypothetical protein